MTLRSSGRLALVFGLATCFLIGCSSPVQSQTEVRIENGVLFLSGTLDHESKPLIISALDQDDEIETIAFTVNPGSIDDECVIELGREIRRRGLNTRLVSNGVLISGGLTLFLSGVTRTLEGPATIGVHSWEGCSEGEGQDRKCKDAMDFPVGDPAHRLHGDYVNEMLGSDEFYWFSINASPSDSVHWLSPDEIARFDLADLQKGGVYLSVPTDFNVRRLRDELCKNCPDL